MARGSIVVLLLIRDAVCTQHLERRVLGCNAHLIIGSMFKRRAMLACVADVPRRAFYTRQGRYLCPPGRFCCSTCISMYRCVVKRVSIGQHGSAWFSTSRGNARQGLLPYLSMAPCCFSAVITTTRSALMSSGAYAWKGIEAIIHARHVVNKSSWQILASRRVLVGTVGAKGAGIR